MEGTPEVIQTFKMYENGKNLTRTGHIMATLQLLASDKVYSSLPADAQTAIKQAATKAWGETREAARKDNQRAEDELKKLGVVATDPDLKPFREAVRPFWTQWAEKNQTTALVDAIQKQ